MLAPFDNTEDYSTASLLKNKGPALTMEVLAALTVEQMVEELIKKAGVIDFERLLRLLSSACAMAKKPLPKEADLINALVTNYCYVNQKNGTLICKSALKFEGKSQKRLVALRETAILLLEHTPECSLVSLFDGTEAKFDELKDIVTELTTLTSGVCIAKSFPGTLLLGKLTDSHLRAVREAWVRLE